MKGLNTLIRVRKLKLEDQQRTLANLENVANGFRAQILSLESNARDEANAVAGHEDTAHTLGAFVQASISRRETLQNSLTEIETEITGIREEVADAFREMKRYEVIEERRQSRLTAATQRRERQTENELGLSIFHRRKGAAIA